jgi:hypothetical protein
MGYHRPTLSSSARVLSFYKAFINWLVFTLGQEGGTLGQDFKTLIIPRIQLFLHFPHSL